MAFASIEYIIFFVITLCILAILRQQSHKKYFLLVVSYVFYAYWDYRFVLLLIIMTIGNYFVGLKIEGNHFKRKRLWLIVGIIFNLIILGFFKYYNFFINSANLVLDNWGVRFPLVDVVLPIAISFITFEVMSYIIDIYRGSTKSTKSFVDIGVLVAFFPHLIAGPILKPNQFLPQLERNIHINWGNIGIGAQIFLIGLVKKVLIADHLAVFVDPVFEHTEHYSSTTVWLAVFAYAIQIYCDFSGYSDMAIGSARCMSLEIPRNFNLPYISRNITEFWKRWHISLSTWLKEYVYFSLGGNRKGKIRTYINLLIVMLLGGLWHGASWNFVLWGGLHGCALVIHKTLANPNKSYGWFINSISILLTFLFVCLTWVFFRTTEFSNSLSIFSKLLFIDNSRGIEWYPTSFFLIVPVMIVAHYLGNRTGNYPIMSLTSFRGIVVVCFVVWAIVFLAPSQSSPFIYFQF